MPTPPNSSFLRPFLYKPSQNAYSILYEDGDILVIDKPAGLLSVPGKALEHKDSLQTQILAIYPEALLVHRLDMATSGLIIFARNAHAQRHFGLQFEKRVIKKTYTARVTGHVLGDSGHINLPLITDWPNRPRQKVCFENGRPSQTDWCVVDRDRDSTRLQLHPITGRSHQLRVHMLAIGHAILGDRLYANDKTFTASPRLCLHATEISFRHPVGGAWHTVISNCPF